MKNTINQTKEILDLGKKNISFWQKLENKKMAKLFEEKSDKALILDICDQAFRPKKTKDTALVIRQLLNKYGYPKFLSFAESLALKFFYYFSPLFHFVMIPSFKWYITKMSSKYVAFGNINQIAKKINKYQKQGLLTNINRVGELLLGEKEANSRIEQYIEDLKHKDVKCISIKASTLYSQINLLAFSETVDAITKQLIKIYKAAKENYYLDENGQKKYKLINLDMEEYKDLFITLAAYRKALNHPELKDLQAGIALQAYLPDSFYAIKKIVAFAKTRVKQGGAPLRVRIVKGANMEMELFESCEKHWELATYNQKHFTDANHKRIINYLLEDDNFKYVNVGIASHNVFDICYYYQKIKAKNAQKYFTWEMLSGMCDNIAKIISKKFAMPVLLYLPFSNKDQFINSISYLVRRFDENTSKDNYLRYINSISQENLKILEEKFNLSLQEKLPNIEKHRTQNRLEEEKSPKNINAYKTGFYKAQADSDFTILDNLKWLKKHKNKFFRSVNAKEITQIPTISGGKDIFAQNNIFEIFDHNNKNLLIAQHHNASPSDAKTMLESARNDKSWLETPLNKRLEIIAKGANLIKKNRGDLIMKMAADGGKIFSESDVEISEAIDFCEFYSHSYLTMKEKLENCTITAKGTVLVLSPWNFPFAIPVGGIVAALIAGNNVIYKPSNLTVLSGYMACKFFWDAGVPKSALQFCPTQNHETAISLTKSNLVDFIVFTGSTATALNIMKNNPKVDIAAETGGKNFTIATKNCDKDQVIKNVLQSAFSNSGQKCSATSVLALEKELYQDQNFISSLQDAVESLKVDFAWNADAKVGPLIRKPNDDLLYALTKIEKGEKWIVKPKQLDKNGLLWSPGLKYGVKENSKSHLTEFFGPVLAIMQINDVADGVRLANATGYGLTCGIESLNRKERDLFKEIAKAGNLYLNRGTTGAIVNRQPFGGMGKSAYGIGIKAGGYNYIYQFVNIVENKLPKTISVNHNQEFLPFLEIINADKEANPDSWFLNAAKNYLHYYDQYFSKEIDYNFIPGQLNIARFVAAENSAIYINKNSDINKIHAVVFAACLTNKKANIIFEDKQDLQNILAQDLFAKILKNASIKNLELEEFSQEISKFSRVRFTNLAIIPEKIIKNAASNGTFLNNKEVFANGRIELLNYMQEQSFSHNYHRYGYISFHDRKEIEEIANLKIDY